MTQVMRFLPGGEVRAIWSDNLPLRTLGCLPKRASQVEVIEDEGPFQGYFHVDMSRLAIHADRPDFMVCLWPPCTSYTAAVAAEQEWIRTHWVRYGVETSYVHSNQEAAPVQPGERSEVLAVVPDPGRSGPVGLG